MSPPHSSSLCSFTEMLLLEEIDFYERKETQTFAIFGANLSNEE
jgi:hypothetical protein